MSLIDQINKSSWCCYNNISTSTQCRQLWHLWYSSKNNRMSECYIFSIGQKTFSYLDSKLSSWCQYQRTDMFFSFLRLSRKSLKCWNSKRCCFSRSCLCTSEKIFSFKKNRYRLWLNGCWFCISCLSKRFENRSNKGKIRELHREKRIKTIHNYTDFLKNSYGEKILPQWRYLQC